MRVVVLAIGNTMMGDKGVALFVLDELRRHVRLGEGLELCGTVMGGIAMMTQLVGFDKALIIDADKTPGATPGEVRTYTPETMEETLHAAADPGNVARVLELGNRYYPGQMPGELVIIGIETESIDSFKEGLTPAVAAAVPRAVEVALGILRGWGAPGL